MLSQNYYWLMFIKLLLALLTIFAKEGHYGLSRPFWFIQLWLNSIFKSHLQCDKRFSPSLKLEGAKLIYYTPSRKPSKENYKKHIEVLLNSIEFTEDLVPFVQPNIARHICLKKTFLVETLGEQAKLIKMWTGFLTWDILVVGLSIKDVVFFIHISLNYFPFNFA